MLWILLNHFIFFIYNSSKRNVSQRTRITYIIRKRRIAFIGGVGHSPFKYIVVATCKIQNTNRIVLFWWYVSCRFWHISWYITCAHKTVAKTKCCITSPFRQYVCIVNENITNPVRIFPPHHQDSFVNSNPLQYIFKKENLK